MADNLKSGQSCLEKYGIDARHEEIVRNDYNINDEYNAQHPNAISDGDVKGKGTGGSAHGAWVPRCSSSRNTMNGIDYSNFETSRGGGKYDIEGRNAIGGRMKAMASSLYNANAPYGSTSIDTSANVEDGQVQLSW